MTAPDPSDYGYLPGDGEFLRGIPERPELAEVPADQHYDMAKRLGITSRHTRGSRPLVNLPTEDDVQLGSRWTHLLTPDQMFTATERGLFRHLMNGHDPDAAGTPATS